MAQRQIPEGTTHVIRVEGFHDARDPANLADPDNPSVFLDAATTAEAQVFSATGGVLVPLGSPITLVPDGDGGNYGGDLPHDFESSVLKDGLRIAIVSTMEDGAVHWETPTSDRVHMIT